MQPLTASNIEPERSKMFLALKENTINKQILNLENPELLPVEKINQMLLKVRNPMLSTEELFDIFNEISVLFFDNKTSIYF